jgi:hypothetical protein
MQRTPFLGTLTGSLQQSWGFLWADQFHRDAHPLIRQYVCVCVFSYCRTYYKAVRVGGGGEWRTCAMRDDEPRPVWMSLLITH